MLPLLFSWVPSGFCTEMHDVRIPWSEVGISAVHVDDLRRGPERVGVGPDGRVVFHGAARHEVVIVEGSTIVSRFPVRTASDLLPVQSGVLVLDGGVRELQLWSASGDLLSHRLVPALTPSRVSLVVVGDQVGGRDLFGNIHPLATLPEGATPTLEAPQSGLLQAPSPTVRWHDGHLRTEGLDLALPEALQASGQRFGDWLVADVVVADSPLSVTRTAWHVPSGASVELPVKGRLYAPHDDVALSPRGELVVLVPRETGLEILTVSP